MKDYFQHRVSRQRTVERLEQRILLTFDSLVISEFAAKNDSAFVDSDGEQADWIEIYNPTGEAINLDGWSLTDDEADPRKWAFPPVELPARSYEVVFASDKNRRIPSEELHANFKLSGRGEYLALLNPTGEVTSEFSPEYPEFETGVSYGFPAARATIIDDTTTYKYSVPTTEIDGWNSLAFDDLDWAESTGAIGFDVRSDFPNAGFERSDLSEWETLGTVSVQQASFGTEPRDGDHFAVLDSTGSNTTRRSAEGFLDLERFSLDQIVGEAVSRVSALKRSITVDAGSVLELDWQLLTDERIHRDFGFITISDGTDTQLLESAEGAKTDSPTVFERASPFRTFRHVFAAAGTFTIGIGVAQTVNTLSHSAIVLDKVVLDGAGDAASSYASIVTTDVAAQFAGTNTSLWTRYEFDIDDPDAVRALQLDAKFDDGFVAYINGIEVAARNAPQEPLWNSSATGVHPNRDATRFESLYIIGGETLRSGPNVLAVLVLNSAQDRADLLWQAALHAVGPLSDQPAFLPHPSPGQPNFDSTLSFAEPVQFDVAAGFYEGPFALSMSVDTPEASIRYTVDGSAPTAKNGIEYEDSIVIDSSTVVRAVGIRAGFESREITTASYLFLDDVVTQTRSSALAAGFPSSWGDDGAPTADYAMDRDIIGPRDRFGGKYAATVRDDLLSVPSISIVMDQADLFGETGIYSNPSGRGEEWERPTSVEFIDSDRDEQFQVDAGIRIQGGISRVISSKLSMRLIFRGEYGDSKLSFPLFGKDGPSEFDSISLRSSSGEQFVGVHYIRDEFLRRTQLATGNPSSRGTYMHLYINGVYWGLYNPTERVSAQFAVNHDGGKKEDYDVINAGDLGDEGITAIDGSRESWDELVVRAKEVGSARSQSAKTAALLRLEGKTTQGENDEDNEAYLNVDNFIDYLIVNVFAGNIDWPHRNYYMYRKRGADSEGFKFQVWDAEFSLDAGENSLRISNLSDGPTTILPDLLTSEAFAVRFADRAQKLFAPGGALYVNSAARIWDPERPFNNEPARRYAELAAEARSALVPESARWGDETGGFNAGNPELFTRDEDWDTRVQRNLRVFFSSRSASFLSGLRSDGLYIAAPTFSATPGTVDAGTRVSLSTENVADIYYTLDGSDPRTPNGGIADSAIKFGIDIAINGRTNIRVRSRAAGKWSAIQSGTFLVGTTPASTSNLAISEIHFNPRSALPSLGELDVDNDRFEFVELRNVGTSPIDLTGVRLEQQFSQGIEFRFGEQTLAVGESVVIPRDVAAFKSRYGANSHLAVGTSINAIGWHFDGSLDNAGDTLRVLGPNGFVIQSLAYDDSDEWPERADGNGSSLEPIDLRGDLSNPRNWRSSSEFGGSPGQIGQGPDNRVVINEVRANSAAPLVDQIELKNTTGTPIDMQHWYLSDSSNDYFKFRFESSTVIAADAYWSLLQSDFRFDMDGFNGDDLFLIEADADGRPLKFVDRVDFDAMAINGSLARWIDGLGRLYPAAQSSFGGMNSSPQIGDIIISEIQASANLDGVDGISNVRELEFVELYNQANAPIDLAGWEIAGNIDFAFGEATTIDPGSAVTLVGFDPIADPTRAALFQLLYQSNSVLAGPYTGTLNDLSGTVRLTRPIDSANVGSQIIVDEVRYDSSAPWPSDVIASDNSIQRDDVGAFGSQPSSWSSARATPGTATFNGIVGDLTSDGAVDIDDVDAICSAIRTSERTSKNDLNNDGVIDTDDLFFLVTNVLGTTAGDANLDGIFNSRDLVVVFRASSFEDDIDGNSTWADGDWNCDGDFTTFDLVVAFRAASYSPNATPQLAAIDNRVAARRIDPPIQRIELAPHQQTNRNRLLKPAIRNRDLESRQVDSLFAS